jgi:3-keto-5-aminohexanoate cleavage enzyme
MIQIPLERQQQAQRYSELIVNFCPSGMITTKAMTRHVPVSPAAVIEDACRALERGVAMVHLPPTDDQGKPVYYAGTYERMILGIREHFPDAIISVSCSARNFAELERRSEVLELTGAARPDLASLALTSLDLLTVTSHNAPDMVIALGEKMVRRGIKPELECFDLGMINAANMLIRKGLLGEPPYYFNLLLGSRYSVPATARHLSNLIQDLPGRSVWSATGGGLFQLPISTLAIAMGGHCRVELADNIDGIARLAEIFGRSLATPARARELLGLGPYSARQPLSFDFDEQSGQPTHV